MSIAEYFTQVKSIWDELDSLTPLPVCECQGCSCGLTKKVLKLQQDQRLMSFLMKVDEQYAPIKTNILMLPELPNVSTAYRMLQQEQKHKELSKLNASTNKRSFYDKPQHQNKHYKHNSSGSYTKSSSGFDSKRNSMYFCEHCKIAGHSIEKCFKVHGYPPGFKHKKFYACVQDDEPKMDKEDLGLTTAQLHNLLNYLNKHKDHTSDFGSKTLIILPFLLILQVSFVFFLKLLPPNGYLIVELLTICAIA